MISQTEVLSEMKKFVRVNTFYGLSLYIIDVTMYVGLICGVLFLPYIWMKIIASVLAGLKISNLATVAHDAAHNSLTKNRTLNKFIAVTALLPCMINYRLWVYNHHQLHHALTNLHSSAPFSRDNYAPFSKEEFDALTPFNRWKEKIYRRPSLYVFGIYFMLERWLQVMLFPRDHMQKRIHPSAWRYFVLVTAWFTGYITVLCLTSIYSNSSTAIAIILGFVLPFFIFQCFIGFTVYVQHTHPGVAWFKYARRQSDNQKENSRQEFVSVQLTFPRWLALLMQMHHAYDHGAHHVCPSIPCYMLGRAQARLNEILCGRAVTQSFSFAWLFTTMRMCKLYDYENHLWLDFDGNPTSKVKLATESIKYANAA